jgi:hypothetical protein
MATTADVAPIKHKPLDIRSYKPDMKMSLPQRAAHYLDWAAASYPGSYTPYNMLLKAIQGYAKTPRVDSDEVERLRRSLNGSVKGILRKQYTREVVTQPGYGIRATSDDLDMVKNSLTKKMVRLRGARNSVAQTVGMVDPANIPQTAEGKLWKDWYSRSAKDVVRQLTSPEFEKKLALPMDTSDSNTNGSTKK